MTLPASLAQLQNGSVPRYTSYPTAPHFEKGVGASLMREMLGSLQPAEPVSLYLHVPYCDRLCWFCGCNTKHTLKYGPVERYVRALLSEVATVSGGITGKAKAGQVHLGGGSPSMLQADDLASIGEALRSAFIIDEHSEISVEIDPSDVTDQTWRGLRDLGVTRASIGVQDFHPEVQAAINRPQSFEQTRDVVQALRETGISSVNIDALYGLPLQTRDRLGDTIGQVISLRPDRVALFGYAHVPWVKKHQTMIREADLPGAAARFEQMVAAEQAMLAAGYEKIGIDHFALPNDSLAVASRKGNLRRNFQGYTTDQHETLIGLGGSSIGKFDHGYVQNIVATAQYEEAVVAGRLAADRGYRMTQDDKIRGFMIERLMCDFEFSFEALVQRFGGDAGPYVDEAIAVAEADTNGLCMADEDRFAITPDARAFTRVVASRFDAHLPGSDFRYSKAV